MVKLTEKERKLIACVLMCEKNYYEMAEAVCKIFDSASDKELIDSGILMPSLGLDHSDLAYEIVSNHTLGKISLDDAINAIEYFQNGEYKKAAELISAGE